MLSSQVESERPMQEYIYTYTSGGGTQTVRTVRNDGESLEDWGQRHEDAVATSKVHFPPD